MGCPCSRPSRLVQAGDQSSLCHRETISASTPGRHPAFSRRQRERGSTPQGRDHAGLSSQPAPSPTPHMNSQDRNPVAQRTHHQKFSMPSPAIQFDTHSSKCLTHPHLPNPPLTLDFLRHARALTCTHSIGFCVIRACIVRVRVRVHPPAQFGALLSKCTS